MNFYQHHIGDFNNATRHLTRIERSIYRDLLELYYDTEKPLTSDFDRLARRCLVDDNDRAAMRDVLNEFFILSDDGYHNTRADREIAAYKRMAEGGKRGAEKRWGKGDDSPPIATPSPPHVKANANHEPETINHEPITINQVKPNPTADKSASGDGFETFWLAYPKRKAKGDAEKAWAKIRDKPNTLPMILRALAWQTSSAAWEKDDGQFIPYPASYLNSKGWLDDPPTQTKNKLTPIGRKSAEATTRWLESQEVLHEKFG